MSRENGSFIFGVESALSKQTKLKHPLRKKANNKLKCR